MNRRTAGLLRPRGRTLLAAVLAAGWSGLLPLGASAADESASGDARWRTWLQTHAREIKSLDASAASTEDLEFLGPLLKDKRLVQLGESGHGVSEFNRAKVRLIKYLHEKAGFDVIAFESAVFECDRADRLAAALSAEDMLASAVFGVWHCREAEELFRYIQETKSTSRPLILAGFDTQISSRSVLARPAAFREAVAVLDPVYAREVFERDGLFVRNYALGNWLAVNGESGRAFYDRLARWFSDHESELAAADPSRIRILGRAAWSMARFIEQRLAPAAEAANIRDKAMADNIAFLAEAVHPDKKIVVWAHNLHVMYGDSQVTGWEGVRPMGGWLSRRWRKDMYTIGFLMGRGRAAWNDRSRYRLSEPVPDGLESLLLSAGLPFMFVDLAADAAPGGEWMFSRLAAKSWGFYDTSWVPRDCFDGILFIRTVTPPDYF